MVGSRRRRAATALACVVVALLAGAGCGSDAPSKASQLRSAASAAGLAPDVVDLVERLGTGPTGAFVAAYTTTGPDGTAQQVTVTQRPPDSRLDVYGPNGSIETTLRTGGRTYQCTKADTWTCAALQVQPPAGASGPGILDPATARSAAEALAQRAADYDFRVEARTLVGVAATCLVTSVKAGHEDPTRGATGTLCLAASGAVLLVDTPTGKLEATDYRTEVPADALTLPVPITPDTTSSGSSGS